MEYQTYLYYNNSHEEQFNIFLGSDELPTTLHCVSTALYRNLGILYTLDLFMRIKNNATRKAVKTIILTFRLASSNHYQLKNGRRHKPKLTMLLQ